MTDRPIIFSGPMVRSLLAGRKTQTRRLATSPLRNVKPGDRLWVKETWKPDAWGDYNRVAVDYRASPERRSAPWVFPLNIEELREKWTGEILANGSVPDAEGIHRWEPGEAPLAWKPSIFMPRWASRITLLVTDVRVQQLCEISETDARREGLAVKDLEWMPQYRGTPELPWRIEFPRDAFADLWDSLHDKPGQRWEDNPAVVAVTFTVECRNIDK